MIGHYRSHTVRVGDQTCALLEHTHTNIAPTSGGCHAMTDE